MPLTLFKTPHIQFLKYKYVALAITFIIILAGAANMFLGKGFKPGVDFGGGTLIRVIYKEPVPVTTIRSSLQNVGLGNSVIQETGKESREVMIRTMQVTSGKNTQEQLEAHEELANKVIDTLRGSDGQAEKAQGLQDLNSIDHASLTSLLKPAFGDKAEDLAARLISFRTTKTPGSGIIEDFAKLKDADLGPEGPAVIKEVQSKTYLGKMTILSKETVGPQAGADLRKKATLAVIWSLIGMLIYIAVRFKLANGVAAILTLTQDVLITLAIYSFTNREINLPVIAALLTIVGFSINDTIVTFDRVRENQKIIRKDSLEAIMNLSINQVLSRTIITSGTVFLTVMALFLFGGKVINDFAFVMLIGSIEGVYSTVYLSCPVVLWWQKLFPSKRGFRK